jgi:L-iditol 2-dehydrogenase
VKALVYHGPRDLRLEERPDPPLGPRDVRIAVRACGICGSELHAVLEAQERRRPGIVMGHEFAGEVIEVGSQVSGVRVGDRVAVQPLTHCGACELCCSGRPNACPNRTLYGMTWGMPGGYAERAVVTEDRCFPIADGVPFELAVLGEPLAVALHALGRGPASVRVAQAPSPVAAQPGAAVPHAGIGTVAVIGTGTVGLLTLVALSTLKPERVFATDKVAWKLDLARSLGATTFLAGRDDIRAAVRDATGNKGVDWAIEAVGIEETVGLALALTRPAGHLTLIGNAEPHIGISLHAIVQGERTLMGSYGYTDEDFRRGLELVAAGRAPSGLIAERRVTLDSAPADLLALATGQWSCVKAVLVP